MKKKLGFFLAIIFGLFFFLGTNVHAEGEKEGWYIGDTQYATFNEAYTAAKTGALTIDRYGDYTQTEDIALAKCVRINMVRGTYTQQGTITCNYNPVYLASSSGEGIYELGTISIASGKNITFESGEFRNLVANSTLLGKMTFQKNDNSLHAVFKIYDESTNELFANKVDSYSVKTDLNPGTQYRICSRGESYASKQSTKASLKTTYTTRGYWKRVSDPASEVKNGTQLLIGYYWSATESLILMKNYENASYQRMYTGAN